MDYKINELKEQSLLSAFCLMGRINYIVYSLE